MVWATAKSVREERSKQRCALQDFSHIRASLIKGKSGWRIASVESYGNYFLQAHSRIQRGMVTFVTAQLRRYVHGESLLPKIYEDAFEVLSDKNDVTEKNDSLQEVFSVRLLAELGYIAPSPVWAHVVEAKSIKDALEVYSKDMSPAIESAIQEGVQASHL